MAGLKDKWRFGIEIKAIANLLEIENRGFERSHRDNIMVNLDNREEFLAQLTIDPIYKIRLPLHRDRTLNWDYLLNGA